MKAALLLGATALALIAVAAASSSSSASPAQPRKMPPPGDRPQPGGGFIPYPTPVAPPKPAPPPAPPLAGLSVQELGEAAAADVRTYGWWSKRGIVRAFQAAYNGVYASMPSTDPNFVGPPEPKIDVDDKWGPQSYAAALRVGVSSPPAAYSKGSN